ncbi:Cro/C1-type HTH DNA-binding domain-containing protein [Sphingobium sp. AP50]|uniref:helix-turn-helix domain-containing protein n=1 Tax=Sphingobium sp. AP50 TaxID=1884369 RepID=UPI0008B51B73|nr:helix-turn-helix transcriptional regulator [Sphingobium sp. AP50]SEK04008.1 Cro/C1-type HTH DNA-binding domain-containing protein [Sphingobium sp. AP50]
MSYVSSQALSSCVMNDRASLPNFVPFILHVMARRRITLRQLGSKTGISKSRLGLLLHGTIERRATMSVDELQVILHALDYDVVHAYIQSKACEDLEVTQLDRHDPLISMLCDAFINLPRILISTLDDLDGVDGTEVRREWAGAIQRTVVSRLIDGVRDIMNRRARLAESEDFRL